MNKAEYKQLDRQLRILQARPPHIGADWGLDRLRTEHGAPLVGQLSTSIFYVKHRGLDWLHSNTPYTLSNHLRRCSLEWPSDNAKAREEARAFYRGPYAQHTPTGAQSD